MPDPSTLALALAVAAASSAAVAILCAWPWRSHHPGRAYAAGVLGVAAGFYLGCWLTGAWPHWPPREDQDRLLLVVIPSAVVAELAAAFLLRQPWIAQGWVIRWLVASHAAKALLENTTYVADLAGPGSREWSPTQELAVLSLLFVILTLVWWALVRLARRTRSRAVPLALGLDCAGAGATVLLSGYASGGQLGLLLGASLAGVGLASLALPAGRADFRGAVGVGVVGLFSVLVIGLFFGQLTRTHAALLFAAPLLGWAGRLPVFRRSRPWLGGVVQLGAVAAVVAFVVAQAYRRFEEEAAGAVLW